MLCNKSKSTGSSYKTLNFEEIGRYALEGKNISKSICYNYFYLQMKLYYNYICNRSRHKERATNQRLVLSKEKKENKLQKLIYHLDRPSGIM